MSEDFILCVVKERIKEHERSDDEAESQQGSEGDTPSSESPEINTQQRNDRNQVSSMNDSVNGAAGAFRVQPGVSGVGPQRSTRLLKDSGTNVDEPSESDPGLNPVGEVGEPRRVSMNTSNLLTSLGGTVTPYFAEATLVKETPDLKDTPDLEEGADEENPDRTITSVDLVVSAKPVASTRTVNRRIAAAVLVVVLVIAGVLLGGLIPNNTKSAENKVTPAEAPVDEDEVIAFSQEEICYSHIPLETDLSRVCLDPASLPQGGPMCQLSAIALLDQTPGAQISLINAGGQRGDILPGNLTIGDVYELMPFQSNRITLVSLSGSLLLVTLEDAIAKSISSIPLKVSISAAYPYTAGLRYDVNLTAPYGSRVSAVEINPGLRSPLGWSPFDVSANYRVTTNNYLAGGGDNYFAGVPEGDMIDVGTGVTDSFIGYCRKVGILSNPTPDEMSTQAFVGL